MRSQPIRALPHTSIGIDLGTTYSLVSLLEKGRPKIIKVDGKATMPSVVSYVLRNGSVVPVVGNEARQYDSTNSLNTFTSIKRIMGKSLEHIKKMNEKQFTSKIRKGLDVFSAKRDPHAHLFCPILKSTISAEEVSAVILRKLIDAAEKHVVERNAALGSAMPEHAATRHIKNAVITVPAYFTQDQREATQRAGILAGLEKVKLLREPEAAAMAYGLDLQVPQLVLVFDLGGGTLDVSVLEVGDGLVEVVATNGDAHLGGDDFDALIVNHVLGQFALVPGVNQEIVSQVRGNPAILADLRAVAELAKRNLSTMDQVAIDLPVLHQPSGLGVSVLLTRRKFEALATPLLTRLLKPLRELALMAGINLPGESGQAGEVLDDEDNTYTKSFEDMSVSELRKAQTSGKAQAKERQKMQGASRKELHRLQKEEMMSGFIARKEGSNAPRVRTGSSGSKLHLFPGGRAVDSVILVGGSTRLPCVRRAVRKITGVEALPAGKVNPDEAVCLGAGAMAGMLDGALPDMKVISPWQASVLKAFHDEQVKGNSLLGDMLPRTDVGSKGLNLVPLAAMPPLQPLEGKRNIVEPKKSPTTDLPLARNPLKVTKRFFPKVSRK